MTAENALKQKVWNMCDVLMDAGVSSSDYVEQFTFLLFLKMDQLYTEKPYNRKSIIPVKYRWNTLIDKDGEALEKHYSEILGELSKQGGMLSLIFKKAQNKIQIPALLKKVIQLIDDQPWVGLDIDVKGAIYEELLQKVAEDTKSGAGQYFTPRPLIKAMVEVIVPAPGETICDPACGTGGFFLAAFDYISSPRYRLDKGKKEALKRKTFKGYELVPNTARLCAMNLMLHGIGGDEMPIESGVDSLASDPGGRYDLVLTNPPFGKKSSMKVVNGDGEISREDNKYERQDFWTSTGNKQLNFVQHVHTLLKVNGRCAIVVPDNVLFEGGAGETVRQKLLQTCDVHTLLRLPTGIFYAQGVKANVLFFDKKAGSDKPWTDKLWIYDFRTNINFTLKENPLKFDDLVDFIKCYNPDNRHKRKEAERFKCFKYDEIISRDKANLDITWLKDDSIEDVNSLPAPEVIAKQKMENLSVAMEKIENVYGILKKKNK
jgi:type I restriction enzyme M protein